MTQTIETPPHELISPTSQLVAIMRSYSDIPYCKEIAKHCDHAMVAKKYANGDLKTIEWMAPIAELRFRALSSAIRSERNPNVVELASGISPRGLYMSAADPITYIETDLEPVIEMKKHIMDQLVGDLALRTNLKFAPLNSVEAADYALVEELLPLGEVTFANEGLLPYQPHPQIAQTALNILEVLKRHGGVWVMSDILTKAQLERAKTEPSRKMLRENVSKETQRKFEDNAFESIDAGEKFFNDLGFSIERIPQVQLVQKLVSMTTLPARDIKRASETLRHQYIWKLRVA